MNPNSDAIITPPGENSGPAHPDAARILGDVGEALAADLSLDALLDRILLAARRLTRADGATLYRIEAERLVFASVHSETLGLHGTVLRSTFPPIPLYDAEGRPNTRTLASYCALYDTTVGVDDVYRAKDFDFSGTRAFDRRSGYHTRSLLGVPIKDGNGHVVAVLQLVNATAPDTSEVVAFSAEHRRLTESLASQAAAAWERHRLTLSNDALSGSLRVHDGIEPWPLTKGQLARLLETCGVPPNLSGSLALRVLCDLVRQQRSEISVRELEQQVESHLQHQVLGPTVLKRFRAWLARKRSRIPLIILIGGTSGTGKSTIAAQCALHLGVSRTQSTDILREVLRGLVPAAAAPELHRSSFQADNEEAEAVAAVRRGLLDQADWLHDAIDGVVERSIQEGESIIIEGVHVLPDTHRRYHDREAVIVPVLLATPSPESLQAHYRQRARRAPKRPDESYLRDFDRIWDQQRFLIEQARRQGVPVLFNARPEATLLQLLQVVTDLVVARFS